MRKIKLWSAIVLIVASTLGFLPETIVNTVVPFFLSSADASEIQHRFGTEVRYCACNASTEFSPNATPVGLSQGPKLSFESLYSDRFRFEGYYVFHCVCRAKPNVVSL